MRRIIPQSAILCQPDRHGLNKAFRSGISYSEFGIGVLAYLDVCFSFDV